MQWSSDWRDIGKCTCISTGISYKQWWRRTLTIFHFHVLTSKIWTELTLSFMGVFSLSKIYYNTHFILFFKRLSGPGHWSMTKCNVFWKAWISMTDDPYLLMYLISRVLCYFIASNSSHKDLYFACLSDIMIVLSCYRIYIIDFITVSETESSQWLRTEHRQLLLVSNGFHNFLPANT